MAGVNPATGFTEVRPTAEERADWDRKRPRQAGHYPYRSACQRCGTRIWHAGIGIGAHRPEKIFTGAGSPARGYRSSHEWRSTGGKRQRPAVQ